MGIWRAFPWKLVCRPVSVSVVAGLFPPEVAALFPLESLSDRRLDRAIGFLLRQQMALLLTLPERFG